MNITQDDLRLIDDARRQAVNRGGWVAAKLTDDIVVVQPDGSVQTRLGEPIELPDNTKEMRATGQNEDATAAVQRLREAAARYVETVAGIVEASGQHLDLVDEGVRMLEDATEQLRVGTAMSTGHSIGHGW